MFGVDNLMVGLEVGEFREWDCRFWISRCFPYSYEKISYVFNTVANTYCNEQ